MAKLRVYVSYKDSILDPQAEAVKSAAHKLGYTGISEFKVGKYFDIDFDGEQSEIDKLADTLLANPNMEQYNIEVLS